ncbi:MAG: glycosyltransferase [Actinomycetota bacterium]
MKVLYANPAGHDYLHASLLEGLGRRTDIELWCLQEGNYGGRAHHCLHGDGAQALEMLADFDVVVIGSAGKRGSFRDPVGGLLHAPKASAGQRWVLVDSCDLGSLPRLDVSWSKFSAVLKRERYLQDRSVRNFLSVAAARRMRHPVGAQFRGHPLLPFPNVQCNMQARPALAVLTQRRVWRLPRGVPVRCEPIGVEPRLVQPFNDSPDRFVTCTLTANIQARREIRSWLAGRDDVRCDLIPAQDDEPVDLVATGAVAPDRRGEFAHNSAYLAWLRANRASITFPGAGFDTARFWEILASGSLLISKRISLDLPVPLHEGRHYVAFDSLRELDDAIRFAVSDSSEVDEIRRRGYELALADYSSAAMAERFVTNELRGPGQT